MVSERRACAHQSALADAPCTCLALISLVWPAARGESDELIAELHIASERSTEPGQLALHRFSRLNRRAFLEAAQKFLECENSLKHHIAAVLESRVLRGLLDSPRL